MPIKVLVAPSGFKESLDSETAANAIESGILRVFPDAQVSKVPIVDGGEGTTRTLVNATGGHLYYTTVTGPLGTPVYAHYGILGGNGPKTGVVELAAAAGLSLVPRDKRTPNKTTTYGVGELIKKLIEKHAVSRILVGCGDSGTNDGGIGLAQALGIRFLDVNDQELGYGNDSLKKLDRIDMSQRHPGLDTVQIDVACNWFNILTGPQGVSRIFGPQKGASPEQVEAMSAIMNHYAAVIARDVGKDVWTINGGGASGGAGAGLYAFLDATLYPRFDIIMDYLNFDDHLIGAELVITAEGALDYQTPRGKVPAEVARRAKEIDLPVLALAGTLGHQVEDNYQSGIDAFTSIMPAPLTLEVALDRADELLTDSAERMMRLVKVTSQKFPNTVLQRMAHSL
ncbi:MAG: glycerate kinase [Chloroflexota bacterium]